MLARDRVPNSSADVEIKYVYDLLYGLEWVDSHHADATMPFGLGDVLTELLESFGNSAFPHAYDADNFTGGGQQGGTRIAFVDGGLNAEYIVIQ